MPWTTLSKLLGRTTQSTATDRRARGFRPRLEALEDRLVPSTLTVDNKAGHAASAFASIQAAVNAAQAGDTVLVTPGTYTEQVVIGAGKDNLTLTTNEHDLDVTPD